MFNPSELVSGPRGLSESIRTAGANDVTGGGLLRVSGAKEVF